MNEYDGDGAILIEKGKIWHEFVQLREDTRLESFIEDPLYDIYLDHHHECNDVNIELTIRHIFSQFDDHIKIRDTFKQYVYLLKEIKEFYDRSDYFPTPHSEHFMFEHSAFERVHEICLDLIILAYPQGEQ